MLSVALPKRGPRNAGQCERNDRRRCQAKDNLGAQNNICVTVAFAECYYNQNLKFVIDVQS